MPPLPARAVGILLHGVPAGCVPSDVGQRIAGAVALKRRAGVGIDKLP